MEESKLTLDQVSRDRFGVFIGTGIGGLESMEREARRLIEQGPSRISPFAIICMMGNAASALVSLALNLRGPNICFVTACATASNSVGEAWRAIKWGDADVFLAGGCEATITPLAVAGFAAMKALSLRNAEPEEASRPFDKNRDGFVMGQGAGVLVLEELELAGYGCTADAHHMTRLHPEGLEIARAMRIAMRHAKASACDVDYINAHATSTPVGDICETRAIKLALGADARRAARFARRITVQFQDEQTTYTRIWWTEDQKSASTPRVRQRKSWRKICGRWAGGISRKTPAGLKAPRLPVMAMPLSEQRSLVLILPRTFFTR